MSSPTALIGSGKRRGWRETAATVRTGRWGTDADPSTGLVGAFPRRSHAVGVRIRAYPAGVIVLGIDPGTASTGYGVIAFDGRDSRLLAQGTVRTGPRETPERRLAAIQGAIQALIAEHAPVAVALESLFIGVNPRTIMSVCQARGAALAVCGAHGIVCTEYAPSVVKTTVCGFGGAGKEQVMRMVRQLLSLEAAPESDHAADALALALCHAWSARAGERFARARAAR
jgi:crossover junction endodeoxyribonuclease RuvC